jgi:hypothetical protein
MDKGISPLTGGVVMSTEAESTPLVASVKPRDMPLVAFVNFVVLVALAWVIGIVGWWFLFAPIIR